MHLTMDFLDALQHRPDMFGVPKDSYEAVVTYLEAPHYGLGGGTLAGFQELVELKFGEPSSVAWFVLVPRMGVLALVRGRGIRCGRLGGEARIISTDVKRLLVERATTTDE